MLVITVLFITIASCDPSVDDNKPPDKNDPTVNTNVNNGGTTSANEKKELTLPSIYSNIYSQINVYSIFTQSGEYTNMPYFIPVNPGFEPIGIASPAFLFDNQVFAFKQITPEVEEEEEEEILWQFYIKKKDADTNQITIDIDGTLASYEKELKSKPTFTKEYPSDDPSQPCKLVYTNDVPEFILEGKNLILKLNHTITSDQCGNGKRESYFVFIPETSSAIPEVDNPSKEGFDNLDLFFRNFSVPDNSYQVPNILVLNTIEPITFYLSTKFPSEYKSNVQAAFDVYNTFFRENDISNNDDLFILSAERSEFKVTDLNKNIIYWNEEIYLLDNDKDPNFSALAVGRTIHDLISGYGIRSIVSLNAQSFDSLKDFLKTQNLVNLNSSTEENSKTKEDLIEDQVNDLMVAVLIHELGHVLGLRHNFHGCRYEPPSIMDYYIMGEDPLELGSYDQEVLKYGYLDDYVLKPKQIPYHCTEQDTSASETNEDINEDIKNCKSSLPSTANDRCFIFGQEVSLSLLGPPIKKSKLPTRNCQLKQIKQQTHNFEKKFHSIIREVYQLSL